MPCQHQHAAHCPGVSRLGPDGHWRLKLFTEPDGSPKAAKSRSVGVYNIVLYFAPGDLSGTEMCTSRTKGCTALCLGSHAGRVDQEGAVRDRIIGSRVKRAQEFTADPTAYTERLAEDLEHAQRDANAEGLRLAVRLNGASDVPWEAKGLEWHGQHYRNLMDAFPDVQFYDYTKSLTRALRSLGAAPGADRWPSNYYLTFSYSDAPGSAEMAERVLAAGGNVAVVYRTGKHDPLPPTWHGHEVIDGRTHDARYLDPRPRVVGLSALGRAAQADTSGFVVDPDPGEERTRGLLRPRSRADRRVGR